MNNNEVNTTTPNPLLSLKNKMLPVFGSLPVPLSDQVTRPSPVVTAILTFGFLISLFFFRFLP